MSENLRPQDQVPVSRTIINEVVTKQVGVLSSNAMSDKRFTSGKSVHNFGIRSAVCVPIKGRERILGVIHVDSSVSENTYTTEQLRLLTAIGYQAGLAIDNVVLHEAAVQSERLAAVGETAAFLSHHVKNLLQALQGGIDLVEVRQVVVPGTTVEVPGLAVLRADPLGYLGNRLTELGQLLRINYGADERLLDGFVLGQVYGQGGDAGRAAGAFANAWRFAQERVKEFCLALLVLETAIQASIEAILAEQE
jgi:hypothetical protein